MKTTTIITELRSGADGKKFIELFDNGNPYVSGSIDSAEIDLCKLIASKTEDADLINEIFCKSALYRPYKWDSDGYGLNVIKKALASIHTAPKKPSFIVTEDKKEVVSAPLLAEWVRKNISYHLVEDRATNAMMIYMYDNGVYKKVDDRFFQGVIKQIVSDYNLKLVKMKTVREAYEQIHTDLTSLTLQDFDNDENIINFHNGILNLDTMELLPHSDSYLSTTQIPYDWTGIETPTPCFDAYMNQLTGGDAETAQFLLKYLGIAMSNIAGYRFKKSLFLIGPGNTGKSQLKSLLEHLLGDENHFAIDLSGIESRFGTSYVYGKRMVGSADMGFLSLNELRTFKQLTGGDSIMAERKGQQAFSFKYNGMLMFCANQTPRFRGDDGEWVYDRFCIVNCNNIIPEGKRDSKLLSKMCSECEGIIYKAIMALRDVIQDGYILREPQSVINARKVYQRDNNIVSAFFDECMEPIGNTPKNNCCTITHIYKVFCKWCSVNNSGRTISKLDFERDLARYLGVDEDNLTERATQGMIVRGYTLNNDGLVYYS